MNYRYICIQFYMTLEQGIVVQNAVLCVKEGYSQSGAMLRV
jgi:hypothetical protein